MAADVQAQSPGFDRSFSSSVLERSSSIDQDPAAMTVEFLRARLLSERSVSKAARQQAEQLAKKVSELERKLEAEIQLRKDLESARLEMLSKYTGELNTEHGNIFDSNSLERDSSRTTGGLKEDRHADVASSSKSDDIERWEHERAVGEGISQPIALELDDDGSQMENFDRVDSAGQLNFEEDGNEGSMNDDEESLGKDKGILAWGRRGARRQQSMDRYGRSFSPKSYESTDAESPHKRWIGKSVRQKRRTDIRVQDPNSEEPVQIEDHEDVEENTGRPEEKKDVQCNGERDTEVERVLERQAEFIERFEEEENAQKAWEEKFTREKNPSTNNGVDIHLQSKEEGSIINLPDGSNSKDEAGLEEVAANSGNKAHGDLSSQQEALASVNFEKAHRSGDETFLKDEVPPAPSLTVHRATLEDVNIVQNGTKKPALIAVNEVSVTSDALQSDSSSLLARGVAVLLGKGLQERQPETSADAKSDEIGEEARFLQASQRQNDSSDTDIQAVERDVRTSSDKHEGGGNLDRHSKMPSSFTFSSLLASPHHNFDMLTENVSNSSPQLQDYAPGRNTISPNQNFNVLTENGQSSSLELQDHATGRNTMKKTVQNPTEESIRTEAFFSDQARVGTASRYSSDEVQPTTVSREEISVGFRKRSDFRESRDKVQVAKGSLWSAAVTGKDGFSRTDSNQHDSKRPQSVLSDKTNDPRDNAAIQVEEVVDILEEAGTKSPWKVRNYSTDTDSSHGFSDKLVRDSPWEDVFRRRIGAQETSQHEQAGRPRTSFGLPAYPGLRSMERPVQYASVLHPNRLKFDNFPSLPGRRGVLPDNHVPRDHIIGRDCYQDAAAFTNHRKSVDGGFDRVMGVLKALQIAKQHIQSSEEQEIDLNAAYRNGHNGRDPFHVVPGSYSPTPLHAKASSLHVGENSSSSSRQSSSDQYGLKRAEQKPYWVSHGTHDSNEYRHDAR